MALFGGHFVLIASDVYENERLQTTRLQLQLLVVTFHLTICDIYGFRSDTVPIQV